MSLDGLVVREEEAALPSGTGLRQLQRGGAGGRRADAWPRVYRTSALQTGSPDRGAGAAVWSSCNTPRTPIWILEASLRLDTLHHRDILALRQTLSGGQAAAAESDSAQLRSLVLKRDYYLHRRGGPSAEIQIGRVGIQSQKAKRVGRHVRDSRQGSGTYSAVVDGYETVLTPDMSGGADPSQLNGVRAAERADRIVGKLIYGDTWYYAPWCAGGRRRSWTWAASTCCAWPRAWTRTFRVKRGVRVPARGGRCVVVLFQQQLLSAGDAAAPAGRGRGRCTPTRGCGCPADALRVGARSRPVPACTAWWA